MTICRNKTIKFLMNKSILFLWIYSLHTCSRFCVWGCVCIHIRVKHKTDNKNVQLNKNKNQVKVSGKKLLGEENLGEEYRMNFGTTKILHVLVHVLIWIILVQITKFMATWMVYYFEITPLFWNGTSFCFIINSCCEMAKITTCHLIIQNSRDYI